MNKKISEISQRAKFIFKVLVENYLSTGQPMGSKSISSKLNYDLSPATIRNVLNEINLHGLIQRDHFSAGSLPSDFGLQFYTQALLEPGQIDINEKQLIDSTNFSDFPQEYEKITSILNGLSNQASLVINNEKVPKISKISLHTIDKKRVIFIVENDDGSTTNRLVETPDNIEIFLQETQNEINKTTKILLEQGIKINKNNKSEKFFVRGLPSLVNSKIDTDLDTLNELLSEIETGKMASKMIKALKKSKGVQIFIGSNTNLFKNTNLSMIFSNYQTKNGLTGAIGVIGPKRIDYQRIVPIVNYMSEIISNKK
jgi:heat-inducible transcriptional repressor